MGFYTRVSFYGIYQVLLQGWVTFARTIGFYTWVPLQGSIRVLVLGSLKGFHNRVPLKGTTGCYNRVPLKGQARFPLNSGLP